MTDQAAPKHPDLAHLWERLHGDADPVHENRWVYGTVVMLIAEVEMLRDAVDKLADSAIGHDDAVAVVEDIMDRIPALEMVKVKKPAPAAPAPAPTPAPTPAAPAAPVHPLAASVPAEKINAMFDKARRESELRAQAARDRHEKKLIEKGMAPEEAKKIASRLAAWPLEVSCAFCELKLQPSEFPEHVTEKHPDKIKELEEGFFVKSDGFHANSVISTVFFNREAGAKAVTPLSTDENGVSTYDAIDDFPVAAENMSPRPPPAVLAPARETILQVVSGTPDSICDALMHAVEADGGWADLIWQNVSWGLGKHLLGRRTGPRMEMGHFARENHFASESSASGAALFVAVDGVSVKG